MLMISEKAFDEWKGYRRVLFRVDGRESCCVEPKAAEGERRYVWRTEFFGAFDSADLALLEKGWHVLYHKVSNLYGCPSSVEYMRAFQDEVTAAFGLNPRAVLFGFSRGGLYAVNYAAAYPERVSALYLDAPVMDINSWPGGRGSGDGDPACWQECLAQYGLTEQSAAGFTQQPLYYAERLAQAHIPIVAVAGLADTCVPYEENLKPFSRRFCRAGGDLRLIEKPHVGHHPHSLSDPTEIVRFLLEKTLSGPAPAVLEKQEWCNMWWEHAADRSRPRVLIIGDSIANGYRHTVNSAAGGDFFANVYATSKALDHPDFRRELSHMWAQNGYAYSLIQFNNGLHGWHLSVEEYARLYEAAVAHIRWSQPDAHLVIALSTPVFLPHTTTPDPDKNEQVRRRNEAAAEIAAKYQASVNDLYTAMWDRPDLRLPDGYHYNEAGTVYQGETVAACIRKLLSTKGCI